MRATYVVAAAFAAAFTVAMPAAQSPPSRPASSQAPSRDARVKGTQTATIRGRILTTDRPPQPVRRALVKLTSTTDSQQWRAATTDVAGRYEIANALPGRYTLVVYKATFITRSFGQRAADEPGKTIELADGQVLESADVALPRAAAILGRVTDERGEPLESVLAAAWQLRFVNGRRQLVGTGLAAATDDQGRYRIGSLLPGRYYISVNASDGSVPLAQTYFPGTNDPGQAQAVTLTVGQEQSGIDFGVVVSRTSRVSGTVFNSSGRPLANAVVLDVQPTARYSIGAGGRPEEKRATVQADGRFTLEAMLPGEHVLSVTARNPDTGDAESGDAHVTLAGSDVDGISLTTVPGARLSGRVRFDPAVNPGFRPSALAFRTDRADDLARVTLRTSPSISAGEGVRDDWSFAVKGVAAGAHRLVFSADVPKPWTLSRVLYRGKDVVDTGIDVRPGEDIGGIEMVLTNRITEIRGVVLDGNRTAVSDCQVVIFPEDSTLWFDRSRWLATTRPDQKGAFDVRGLPPGRYFAVAVAYLEAGEANDPDTLAALRDGASRFTVSAGEPVTLQLTLPGAER